MRVHFLGTGGFHPNERRHTAGVMIPEIGVMFDAGTGTFRAAEQLETDELQIFLSHAHLDHVVGLTYLLVPLLQGPLKRARLYGTPGTLETVRNHLFTESLFPIHPPYEYEELTDEVAVAGGGVVRHVALKHPGGSTGYRLDLPDRALAYITDTNADGTYDEFVRGVDLLIHECYFPDEMAQWSERTGHSRTSAVATLAKNAGVGHLVLVHIDPRRPDDDPVGLKTARAIFPNTTLAEDRMAIKF